ncbi:unnamed protein product [Macrosiphum euphorbiae]|uniref:Secreted protein n=1 Tax=Macrosiphum euphorbiae TaxID=13131 RepID=A0AAV0VWN1_9HEMI|nr:unnamed protein product [Macrosiphum euphorbiae]
MLLIGINWLVAGVALVTDLTALADWTCPTTTMFMVTFSAPIFCFFVGFSRSKEVKTAKVWICTKIALCPNEAPGTLFYAHCQFSLNVERRGGVIVTSVRRWLFPVGR